MAPVAAFPDPRYLIGADELAARLDEVTLIDLRPAEDFALGRIGKARHLDIYGVSLNDSAPAPLEAFLAIFTNLFGARGITAERPVVIYDHESGERGARAVWLLALCGHPDVRQLDGGSHAWLAAGHTLDRVSEAPTPVDPAKAPPTSPPFRAVRDNTLLATRFDVDAAIDDPGTVILDVRRASEHHGTEKRAKRVGTVPGAVHVFWREHLDAQGRYRSAGEIRQLYESSGVTPDKSIIAYCQGGYRSASTFIALKSLGYPHVKNYVGSWGEWGNRDDSRITLP